MSNAIDPTTGSLILDVLGGLYQNPSSAGDVASIASGAANDVVTSAGVTYALTRFGPPAIDFGSIGTKVGYVGTVLTAAAYATQGEYGKATTSALSGAGGMAVGAGVSLTLEAFGATSIVLAFSPYAVGAGATFLISLALDKGSQYAESHPGTALFFADPFEAGFYGPTLDTAFSLQNAGIGTVKAGFISALPYDTFSKVGTNFSTDDLPFFARDPNSLSIPQATTEFSVDRTNLLPPEVEGTDFGDRNLPWSDLNRMDFIASYDDYSRDDNAAGVGNTNDGGGAPPPIEVPDTFLPPTIPQDAIRADGSYLYGGYDPTPAGADNRGGGGQGDVGVLGGEGDQGDVSDAGSSPTGDPFLDALTDIVSAFSNALSGLFDELSGLFASGLGDFNLESLFGGGGFDFDLDFEPVILDLTGAGIKITPLTQSGTFSPMSTDGYQHLTAWAGVGNGVLFYDASGTGSLTQHNQFVFTDWDPSAHSDMQALLDVFDTNHNGALDAGDAKFASFFVMQMNGDGSQTPHSLSSLGITSINLVANAVNIALPDGSAITGETTYTNASGTHAVATATLAADPNGYLVSQTKTANSDSSVTIDNLGVNPDGSVAFERILNTASSGARTLTSVNAGGVVTSIQTDVTTVSGGITTEVVTNYAGGTISASNRSGSLGGSVSTTGARLVDSTTTSTSTVSGTTTVTILRDQRGGGWTTQKEVDTTNPDGSSSIVVSNLNPDNTMSAPDASLVTTTSVSADGLTRTVTSLVDGASAKSTTSTDATVVNQTTGVRTETVTSSRGTTVVGKTVTVTSSDGRARTIASDLADGTTLNLTTGEQTVTNANGSSTTTVSHSTASGALIDETVTGLSADGNTRTTSQDRTGTLSAGAPVFDLIESDATTFDAGGNRTETVIDTSANGTQRSKSVTYRAATGAATTTTITDPAGFTSSVETIEVSAGVTTDTVVRTNGAGTMVGETVTTTSSGGLSKTVQVDATGTMSGGSPVFDHTTVDAVVNNAGASVETITAYGLTSSNKISQTQITTTPSASGVTTTTNVDTTGSGAVADGALDQVTVDQVTAGTGNTIAETITVSDGYSHVLSQTLRTTSGDRRTVTTTQTLGTNGLYKKVETVSTQNNGSVVDQIVQFDKNGDVTGATVTTTSADGLTISVQRDISGQSAATFSLSGLAFDQTANDVTTINADGSRTETISTVAANNTILSTRSLATSANTLTATTTENPYAAAHYASQTSDVTTLNADGSRSEVVSKRAYNSTLLAQQTTTTNATGLSTTTLFDLNGDGQTDQAEGVTTTFNADGSQTAVDTRFIGGLSGSVRDTTTTTSGQIVSGAGLKTTKTYQSNGSVPYYLTETISPDAAGVITDIVKTYAQSGGALLLTETTTTAANGFSTTHETAINGHTTRDFWTTDAVTLNADGSQTETVATYNATGLVKEKVTTSYPNGLNTTTSLDANGAMSGGNPVFNKTTTDVVGLNSSNGSRTETVTTLNANAAAVGQTVITTSADGQTITTNRSLNETGSLATIDQSETKQTQDDGSILDTTTSYDASHALTGTKTVLTAANGLSKTTQYKDSAGAIIDTATDTTSLFSDGHTTLDREDSHVVSGFPGLASSAIASTAGNGQSVTKALSLNGALSTSLPSTYTASSTDVISVSDAGVSTETVTSVVNGSSSASDIATTVTSANGRSVTINKAYGGASGSYFAEQKTTALDGSTTDTATFYNAAALSQITAQTVAATSADGRTVTTAVLSDYDGSRYDVQQTVVVQNADGSTSRIRIGTGSFGVAAYRVVSLTSIAADGGQITTASNFDRSGVLDGQIVSEVSANGLVTVTAIDPTGQETAANLTTAAANLISGAALPSSLLATDILGSDATVLNADGSTTETRLTAYGASLSNLRSKKVTTTSANGLSVTDQIDNDGNGVFEETITTTTAPDGLVARTVTYKNNTTAAVIGSNFYSQAADDLVTSLTSSIGVQDTTSTLSNANGSYQFARTVTPSAAALGYVAGSASHAIDENGIDTWSWDDGVNKGTQSITIDVQVEQRDITLANEVYQAALGREMSNTEREYLGSFISNGELNRSQLALALLTSSEYRNYVLTLNPSGGGMPVQVYWGFTLLGAFQNGLGRLPSASEMANFDNLILASTAAAGDRTAATNMILAVAQYADDIGVGSDRSADDPNRTLITSGPLWINSARNKVQLTSTGTYNYSGSFITDGDALMSGSTGVTATVAGNNNIFLLASGSNVTANGLYNAVDVHNGAVTLSISAAAVLIEPGSSVALSGNSNQISQVGFSQLTLSSGSGNIIYLAPSPTTGSNYANPYPITSASNATITLASGVGTLGAQARITGNSNTITFAGNDNALVTGSAVSVKSTGGGNRVAIGTGTTATITMTGSNILDYSALAAGVYVDIPNGVTKKETTAGVGWSNVTTATTSPNGFVSDALQSGVAQVIGSPFDDRFYGGAGSDWFNPEMGNDIVYGGGGVDTVDYSDLLAGIDVTGATVYKETTPGVGWANPTTAETAPNGYQTDSLVNVAHIVGTAFTDRYNGTTASDWFNPGMGNDIIYGGGGTDIVDYSNLLAGVYVDMTSQTTLKETTSGVGWSNVVTAETAPNGYQTDTFFSIVKIVGSNFDDRYYGTTSNDTFAPGMGNDVFYGQGGTDTVDYSNVLGGVSVNLSGSVAYKTTSGGSWKSGSPTVANTDYLGSIANAIGSAFDDRFTAKANETMTGGAGADTFVYTSTAITNTVIGDFSPGQDVLSFASGAFGTYTTGQSISLVTGTGTPSQIYGSQTTPGFAYDTSTGKLWFDVGGGAQASLVTTLTGAPTIHATDFVIA